MTDKKKLITKYLNGDISKDELNLVLKGLEDEADFEGWRSDWESALEDEAIFVGSLKDDAKKGDDLGDNILLERITYTIERKEPINRDNKTAGKLVRWAKQYYYVAAVAIALLFFGTYFYRNYVANPMEQQMINVNHPVKDKAILKRADGSIIELDTQSGPLLTTDGHVVYNTGETVLDLRPSENEELRIQTPRGITFSLVLPDGTQVWMNSASTLTYSSGLLNAKQEREVHLEGEAYFEVKKNDHNPFIVKSPRQELRVLGTHFNINAYADEDQVKTTLLEGRVRLSSISETPRQVDLIPGQQAVLGNDNYRLIQADPAAVLDWKEGQFYFEREKLPVIMRKIARWYDVDIVYNDTYSPDDFSGIISREKTLKEVLQMLELTGLVHFKIEGRRVIVMP